MFKVVYDTNVVVSGLLSSVGIPALLLDLVLNERLSIFLSAEVFDEYERVISRTRFRIPKLYREAVLKRLKSVAQWVEPQESVRVASDSDDNRFLDCAVAGRVDFLVTGNRRHFPKTFRGIRVVSPRLFFEIYLQSSMTE